jgi:hypothetical protein
LRTLIALAAVLLSGVASAQTLSTTGSCPGDVTIAADGLTPGGNAVFLIGAAGEGSDVIGIGACSGTVTGLAGLRMATRMTVDGGGMVSGTPYVGDANCDTPVQVLDTATCTLSNVDSAGSADGMFFENELLPGDGYAYASIDDVPVMADYGTWENDCQLDYRPLPEGWEIVPDGTPSIADIIYSGGWSTHCMFTDNCSYGTFNYVLGDCGCGYFETDGLGNWAVTSCARRMMIRRPL